VVKQARESRKKKKANIGMKKQCGKNNNNINGGRRLAAKTRNVQTNANRAGMRTQIGKRGAMRVSVAAAAAACCNISAAAAKINWASEAKKLMPQNRKRKRRAGVKTTKRRACYKAACFAWQNKAQPREKAHLWAILPVFWWKCRH